MPVWHLCVFKYCFLPVCSLSLTAWAPLFFRRHFSCQVTDFAIAHPAIRGASGEIRNTTRIFHQSVALKLETPYEDFKWEVTLCVYSISVGLMGLTCIGNVMTVFVLVEQSCWVICWQGSCTFTPPLPSQSCTLTRAVKLATRLLDNPFSFVLKGKNIYILLASIV